MMWTLARRKTIHPKRRSAPAVEDGEFADMLRAIRLERGSAQAPAITVLTLGFFRLGSRILGAQDHQYLSEH